MKKNHREITTDKTYVFIAVLDQGHRTIQNENIFVYGQHLFPESWELMITTIFREY